jgi:hypothetical protein
MAESSETEPLVGGEHPATSGPLMHEDEAGSPAPGGSPGAPPHDDWNAAYAVLLFLGVTMLLTYNSFVAAPDYTSHYYRYAAQDERLNATMPNVWRHISPFITAANMVPNLVCQTAMLTNFMQRLPVLRRLYAAIVLNAVAMLIVPIAPAFRVDEHGALAVLLIGDAICGGATAVLQSSAFAIAAQFPVTHTQGTMLGIGVSGTVVSLVQIITYAAFGSSFSAVLKQSSIFFGIGVLALLVNVVLLPVLQRSPFARHYVLEWRRDAENEAQAEAAERSSKLQNGAVTVTPAAVTADAEATAHAGDEQAADVDTMRVLGVCKWNMLANFFVYAVTLFIFPGLGVAVEPDSNWYGIIIIFMYNFGDFGGRMLCRFDALLLRERMHWLQLGSLARVVFVPLFMLCVKPRAIDAPALPMVMMYLVGVSNGFVSSQLMMFTPASTALHAHERASAGSAMSLSLLGGCCAGSLSALLLSQTYLAS